MTTERVYVALDWSRDAERREALESWALAEEREGRAWELVFCDAMTADVTADNLEEVQAAVRAAVQGCRYTLVLVGEGANQRDKNSRMMGFRNWMNFEVEESISNRNRICAVKLNWMNTSPDALANTHATWAQRFEADFIARALRDA